METVVTIVGKNITSTVKNCAAGLVREAGGGGVCVNVLHSERAIDILVNAYTPELTALLRKKLAALGPVDIFIQPNDKFRKKKLLVADMDATMIRQETLDELAEHVGLKDKIAPITEKAMRGEIDFQEALKMRVGLLKGMSADILFKIREKIEYCAGAAPLVKTMNKFGNKCVLVSGGFDFFTRHVAGTLGFHRSFGNRLVIHDNKLTGDLLLPIIDKHLKERLLVDQAKEMSCDLKHVLAIGDGANDILMLKKAGVGVGYFGKPAVVAATPHQIRHTDLTSMLYMQGYRQDQVSV